MVHQRSEGKTHAEPATGLGSVARSLGAVIDGIARAAGGWWAGEKVGRVADEWSDADDRYYHGHFESLGTWRVEDYEGARIAYVIGHLAGQNPEYGGRRFEEIERNLWPGFADGERDYDLLRPYVRAGYEHTRARMV